MVLNQTGFELADGAIAFGGGRLFLRGRRHEAAFNLLQASPPDVRVGSADFGVDAFQRKFPLLRGVIVAIQAAIFNQLRDIGGLRPHWQASQQGDSEGTV